MSCSCGTSYSHELRKTAPFVGFVLVISPRRVTFCVTSFSFSFFPLVWPFYVRYFVINSPLLYFTFWSCSHLSPHCVQTLTELSGHLNIDPAETEKIKQVLSSQGVLIGQHGAALVKVMETLQQFAGSVNQLNSGFEAILAQHSTVPPVASSPPAMPALTVSPTPTSDFQPCEPYIPIPARYLGDLGSCSQFLYQCLLIFSQQLSTYPTDSSKVAFVSSLLSNMAAAWALAFSSSDRGNRRSGCAFTVVSVVL